MYTQKHYDPLCIHKLLAHKAQAYLHCRQQNFRGGSITLFVDFQLSVIVSLGQDGTCILPWEGGCNLFSVANHKSFLYLMSEPNKSLKFCHLWLHYYVCSLSPFNCHYFENA